MRVHSLAAGLSLAIATAACAGMVRTPSVPPANALVNAAPSRRTVPPQRLYVAYHAKTGDWIGEYTTGNSPSLVLQITQNVAKPYALYADAKGVVYSAQKGFSEYDA